MAFALLLGTLSACSGTGKGSASAAEDPAKEITIAFIGNTTGDYAEYGTPVRNAVMLYFDQLNAKGGINGKQVRVLEYDDKGDGVDAVSAYNLACEKGVTAVIGAVMTAPSIALADVTYETGMPQITASATATGSYDYIIHSDCPFFFVDIIMMSGSKTPNSMLISGRVPRSFTHL